MMSLKAFAPILAATLGTTPAAIYERQRALIRTKLLPTPIGRGRGNGLPATAETVAMLLIAVMVTDNLSDTDDRVRKLANAQVVGRGMLKRQKARCRLTGKRDFKSALISILRSKEYPAFILVQVSRTYLTAKITYGIAGSSEKNQDHIQVSEFDGGSDIASGLVVEASLGLQVLETIGKALQGDKTGV
jgi:hypothetical protein